jgi:hypothetical protein
MDMRKKLEAELISIAHRVLKLKSKEDVRELHHEAQKLYEKLSVLLFVEENFEEVKPTIGLHDIEVKLVKAFDLDQKNIAEQTNKIADDEVLETKTETAKKEKTSKIEQTIIAGEESPIIEIPKVEKKQTSVDELLANLKAEPIFERVEKVKESFIPEEITKIIDHKIEQEKASEVKLETKFVDIPVANDFIFDKVDGTNLNDKLKKSLNIALNDRLAFEKNLFGGSSADFNRVVSQLSTFDTLSDAKNFINDMVKPDYDNWKGKEEFADRFMEIVENKFI